jgi:integrase
MPCFTDEDLGQLLAAARKPIEKATILAFATTGARRSELRGVRVDDVDLDRRRILIHGKGGKDREVVISPELLKVLMARICGGDARPGGFLFPSRTGRELCNSTLQRWFTRLIKQAGLEGRGFTIHTLRRYAATRWHRSGVRLRNIQVLLGHESLDTTQRYLSVDLDEAQKQLDELEPLEHEVEVPYPSERAVG